MGLSLSSFLSQSNAAFTSASTAALVAIEGNSYSTVAVLDFGGQLDDESGDGCGRMPWLSMRYPIGDTSSLTRFVIGLEEVILEYRQDTEEAHINVDAEAPANDPWSEDLFHRQRSPRSPIRDPNETVEPATDEAKEVDGLTIDKAAPDQDASPNEQSLGDSYWEQHLDDDVWSAPLIPAPRIGPVGSTQRSILLAGELLIRPPLLKPSGHTDERRAT
jgi:hypothetical protein